MFISANVPVGHTSVSEVAHTVVYDFLPAFALAAALLAIIWLSCAVVTVCGVYFGALAVLGVRHLVAACRRGIQHCRHVEYAQFVTVHPDGVTTKVINLDRYRRRRRPTHSNSTEHTNHSAPDPDESA